MHTFFIQHQRYIFQRIILVKHFGKNYKNYANLYKVHKLFNAASVPINVSEDDITTILALLGHKIRPFLKGCRYKAGTLIKFFTKQGSTLKEITCEFVRSQEISTCSRDISHLNCSCCGRITHQKHCFQSAIFIKNSAKAISSDTLTDG